MDTHAPHQPPSGRPDAPAQQTDTTATISPQGSAPSPAATPSAAPLQLTNRARLAVLGAVFLALFLSSLDQNVVGTALPRIVTDLGGNSLYTWVVTAYLLSSTLTVPIYGKLSDIYGRKVIFLFGITVFLAGSAASGLSQNMTELILFRGLQGVGAGALIPIALAIIGDIFTPREQARYQTIYGAVFIISFALGPLIGGVITDNISWRWVFYVNLPIGVAALAAVAAVLPNYHPPVTATVRDLDYLGIATFTGGVVPLLIGLTNKGQTDSHGNLYSWTDASVGGLILLGVVFLLAFLFVESRAKQPIVPLGLFRSRTFSLTNFAGFVVSFGMFAAIVFLPRYYQSIRGLSATTSGYMIWPLLVGFLGGSTGTGLLIGRIGRYKMILVVSTIILVAGAVLMTQIQAGTADAVLWSWMFVLGLGLGPSMSAFTVVIQNSASATDRGVATGTMTFLRQVGGSVGLAISATLFGQAFAQELPGRLLAHGVPARIVTQFTSNRAGVGQGNLTGVNLGAQLQHTLPAPLQLLIPRIVAGVHDAFALAIGQVFWMTVGGAAAALLAILFLPDLVLSDRPSVTASPAAAVPVSVAPVHAQE